jgi:MHS family proline/betaine transporter-like MFS transporter
LVVALDSLSSATESGSGSSAFFDDGDDDDDGVPGEAVGAAVDDDVEDGDDEEEQLATGAMMALETATTAKSLRMPDIVKGAVSPQEADGAHRWTGAHFPQPRESGVPVGAEYVLGGPPAGPSAESRRVGPAHIATVDTRHTVASDGCGRLVYRLSVATTRGRASEESTHRRTWSREDIRVSDPKAMRRSIAGTAIGNFMEWYDFGVYGFLATTIARVFYPTDSSSAAGLIATFGTLAAAFAVRTFGGIVFGSLGDRIGRKRVLVMTVTLMAIGTTVTGLLPGYDKIGIWAPTLLIITRVLQGFSTGGEYVGAMTYVSEHAPDRSRGLLAGFLPLGTLSGYVVGAAVVSVLQSQLPIADMLDWGWRLPFLLGVPLAIVALYMRLRVEESPAYTEMSQDEQQPTGSGRQQLQQKLAPHRKALLIVIGLVVAENVTNYTLTGYLPSYLRHVGGISGGNGLMMIVVTLAVMLVAVVFVAKLSDRIGRKPIMWAGSGLLIVGSVPAFLLIRYGGGYPMSLIGVLLIGLMLLCFNSTSTSTLPALFPTNVRNFAVAIGFNVSVSAFGGTTPLIAEALVSGTGNVMVPAYILMIAGVVGAVAVWFTPEVAGKPLPGSGPSVATEEEARAIVEAGAR